VEIEADRPKPDPAYRIGCPDVLELTVAERPGWEAIIAVDLDGRLPVVDGDGPRVEGLTLAEARTEIARMAGVPAERVDVRLAVPRSQRIYLHGPIRGRVRIMPYQGPELVMDFLKRVGGLPPGSKLNDVYIVRPNISGGGKSYVYHIDVEAVLLDHDQATNIPLRPSDQVYIGETRRSSFSRVLPGWLRPAYRKLAGLLPDDWRPWMWVKRDKDSEPAPPKEQ
jgi:polysaccharide export outer membrane protein